MRARRKRILIVAGLIAACVAGTVAGRATWAAFTGSATNASSQTSAPDWLPPTVSRAVYGKSAGGVPGYVRASGTAYLYAQVTDQGNPGSGVSTVTANPAGLGNVALASGSWTVDGLTYNYRSALQTITAGTAAGSYGLSVTATDALSQSATAPGFSYVVDNTIPAGAGVQTANGSGTLNRADAGDQIVYSFNDQLDPYTILANWNGSSTNVVVRLLDGGGANDTVQVWDSANTTQAKIGSLDLKNKNHNTTLSTITFGASGTPSTMVLSGNSITVTLGTASAAAATVGNAVTTVHTPLAGVTDRAGGALATSNVNETGASDAEF